MSHISVLIDITPVAGMCEIQNGGCAHLCLALPSTSHRTHVCQCAMGFALASDNQTCIAGKIRLLFVRFKCENLAF